MLSITFLVIARASNFWEYRTHQTLILKKWFSRFCQFFHQWTLEPFNKLVVAAVLRSIKDFPHNLERLQIWQKLRVLSWNNWQLLFLFQQFVFNIHFKRSKSLLSIGKWEKSRSEFSFVILEKQFHDILIENRG